MRSSHGHDMSIVNGIGRIGYMKGGGKALWKDENLADSILAHAVKFIETHKKEPFFMYFATMMFMFLASLTSVSVERIQWE